MNKKHLNLIFRCLFLMLCVSSIVAELYLLSETYGISLICFYLWLPVSVILTAFATIRLVIAIKILKADSDNQTKGISLDKILKNTSVLLIVSAVVLSLGYSAFQIHNHENINKDCYEILNISNFTDCIEDENSDYNVKMSGTDGLFNETDSSVTKMVFIGDDGHQIIVNGCHTVTKSSMLTNLKFQLMKLRLMSGNEYIEDENCVYFYEPGCYDGIIQYSKLIIIVKGDSGVLCATVETSTPDVQILVEKAVASCKDLCSE